MYPQKHTHSDLDCFFLVHVVSLHRHLAPVAPTHHDDNKEKRKQTTTNEMHVLLATGLAAAAWQENFPAISITTAVVSCRSWA